MKENQSLKILGALQPGYLPWIGFFDQIARSDLFLLADDLPYSRHSWRNRNRIKTPAGTFWLTVPVHVAQGQNICEVQIDPTQPWGKRHWHTIAHAYRRAPYFHEIEPWLAPILLTPWKNLSDLCVAFIQACCHFLSISTPLILGSQAGIEAIYQREALQKRDATDRIIFLLNHFQADLFLSGDKGRKIYQTKRIEASGKRIFFQNYTHPVYPQRFGDFIPYLSIVDFLMNCGKCAVMQE